MTATPSEEGKTRAFSIGTEIAKNFKRQPGPDAADRVIDTFAEEKSDEWKEAFKRGFWKEMESSSWQAFWPRDDVGGGKSDGDNGNEEYSGIFSDEGVVEGLKQLSGEVSDTSEENDEEDSNTLTLAPDIVPELLSTLDLGDNSDVAVTANKLAEEHGTTGENCIPGAPSSIAAASVYAAALLKNQHRTQEEVAEMADITPTTLRDKFHKILETYQNEHK